MKDTAIEDRETYTMMTNRFSLQLPLGWQDRSLYRFNWPGEGENKHTISISIEHNVDVPNVKQYAELNIMALSKSIPGFEILKQGECELDNFTPQYEVVYKWIPLDGAKYYQRNVYILINNTGYILSAMFTKKLWKMRAGEVDTILKSFSTAAMQEVKENIRQ